MYVSNTDDIQGSTLCCKDGPQLPPLNFTTTCTEHGRYVMFYNERLKKESYPEGYEVYNVFTELCEVIVQGCKRSDVFGIDCDNPCPANCICMIENGSCLKCKTGWSGTFCDIECMESWYNVNSSQKCVGHCRENSTCNQVTGQCERGCAAGWTGTLCEKACQPGYYGTNCSLACSPNCKTCRHTDGLCSCKAGWLGHNCSMLISECTQSYGENCQYSCSLHCINQTCDRFNGNCLCDDKHESLQNIETLNGPSCTLWIVFFSISMAIHIIFISVTLIGRRKKSLKQKFTTDQVNFPGLNIDQTASTDDPAHYQELGDLKNENAYQTLHQRKN